MDSARQLLDELMGRNRNIDPTSGKVKELHWEDEENCVFFLVITITISITIHQTFSYKLPLQSIQLTSSQFQVSFCPHECFINTKADLGACRKIHDDAIKRQYDEAEYGPSKKRYEEEFLRFTNNMIKTVEGKIQKGKQRLQQHKAEAPQQQPPSLTKIQEQINVMNEWGARFISGNRKNSGTYSPPLLAAASSV